MDQLTCTVIYTVDGSYEPSVPASRINKLPGEPRQENEGEGDAPADNDKAISADAATNTKDVAENADHEGETDSADSADVADAADEKKVVEQAPTDEEEAPVDKDEIPVNDANKPADHPEAAAAVLEPCLTKTKSVTKLNAILKRIMKSRFKTYKHKAKSCCAHGRRDFAWFAAFRAGDGSLTLKLSHDNRYNTRQCNLADAGVRVVDNYLHLKGELLRAAREFAANE